MDEPKIACYDGPCKGQEVYWDDDWRDGRIVNIMKREPLPLCITEFVTNPAKTTHRNVYQYRLVLYRESPSGDEWWQLEYAGD